MFEALALHCVQVPGAEHASHPERHTVGMWGRMQCENKKKKKTGERERKGKKKAHQASRTGCQCTRSRCSRMCSPRSARRCSGTAQSTRTPHCCCRTVRTRRRRCSRRRTSGTWSRSSPRCSSGTATRCCRWRSWQGMPGRRTRRSRPRTGSSRRCTSRCRRGWGWRLRGTACTAWGCCTSGSRSRRLHERTKKRAQRGDGCVRVLLSRGKGGNIKKKTKKGT